MNTETNVLSSLDLERFFSDHQGQYDLVEGTSHNPCGTRMVYLPEDAIRGIYTALFDEAGPACSMIMKNCGILWGRRVAANLERELKLMFETTPGEVSVSVFIDLVEGYFAAHGWGRMSINLDSATDKGYLTARIENSIFTDVLDPSYGNVNSMISGMLKSIFETLAKAELDAIEIDCKRGEISSSIFLISGAERIEAIEEKVESGTDSETILQSVARS
ncbi:MAG: hypothetical protein AAF546_00505 [Verrucomicrobiota bacterium]